MQTTFLALAALLTVAGDFLLWPSSPRLSLGIFAVLCGAAVLVFRRNLDRRALIPAVLLGLGAIQAAVEISFSNLLVMSAALTALVGEVSFPGLRVGWARWSEALRAFLVAPASWRGVPSALAEVPLDPRRAGAALQVAAPTLAIGSVFALLLGQGNAVFGHFLQQAWHEIPGFDFSFGRLGLWLLLATFSLALLRPAEPPLEQSRVWTREVPRFAEPRQPRIAHWQGIALLAALNVLFFGANTTDAIYLWIRGAVPGGVSYSQFVHEGVWSLVTAVLLSAVVLVALYQRAESLVASRALRVLSYAWIAQNVALIASVLLRLKLYVDAYQLSERRVYVAFFLLLVAVGFGLLAWRILRERSLSWLLFANLLATFALFFAVQFLDVKRWVASYNVARWQQEPIRTLDVAYLASLGSSAYRSLVLAAETSGRPEALAASVKAQDLRAREQNRLANQNWRSVQVRVDREARWLAGKTIGSAEM